MNPTLSRARWRGLLVEDMTLTDKLARALDGLLHNNHVSIGDLHARGRAQLALDAYEKAKLNLDPDLFEVVLTALQTSTVGTSMEPGAEGLIPNPWTKSLARGVTLAVQRFSEAREDGRS